MTTAITAVGALHEQFVFNRRTMMLAHHLAELLPAQATVLDVGCGDGTIDELIRNHRPNLALRGVDVMVRKNTKIPVQPFDGTRLPFADGSFDTVMFIDVLHHTGDPNILLREAKRVARQWIVLKDHTMDGALARPTLRLMDWVGNAPHGVALPYNYWPEANWRQAFAKIDLSVAEWRSELGLYPWPASSLFDRRLHFIAKLRR
jgi:SAM-dependent methyltransferase